MGKHEYKVLMMRLRTKSSLFILILTIITIQQVKASSYCCSNIEDEVTFDDEGNFTCLSQTENKTSEILFRCGEDEIRTFIVIPQKDIREDR